MDQLLATMPGVSMFIAVAIVCRIAPIGRFPHGRSLANFLGLTPGSRSSGETERLGSITKVGSRQQSFYLPAHTKERACRSIRHQEWIKFLKLIDAQTPPELDLHLMVDNYATHNQSATPFVGTAKADKILAKVQRARKVLEKIQSG